MCGITAVSRAIISSIPDMRLYMRLAALAIEPRGTDATGFAWTTSEEKCWYWKEPSRARIAIPKAPLELGMTTVIGHTRAATQGPKANNENNHPVVDDGIMLVHNGVIYNDLTLFKDHFDKDYKRRAQVDTQIIASMLAHRDTVFDGATPPDLFQMLRGDAAVAWIETNDPNVLHLARVRGRPMTLARTRKGDLVMSSTPDTMADTALWTNIRLRDFHEVPEGTYLQVRAGEIVHEETFDPKAPTFVSGYTSGGSFTPHPAGATQTSKPRNNVTQTAASLYDDETEIAEWWERQLELEELEIEALFQSGFDEALTVKDLRKIRDGKFVDVVQPDLSEPADTTIDWDNVVPRRGWASDRPVGALRS